MRPDELRDSVRALVDPSERARRLATPSAPAECDDADSLTFRHPRQRTIGGGNATLGTCRSQHDAVSQGHARVLAGEPLRPELACPNRDLGVGRDDLDLIRKHLHQRVYDFGRRACTKADIDDLGQGHGRDLTRLVSESLSHRGGSRLVTEKGHENDSVEN